MKYLCNGNNVGYFMANKPIEIGKQRLHHIDAELIWFLQQREKIDKQWLILRVRTEAESLQDRLLANHISVNNNNNNNINNNNNNNPNNNVNNAQQQPPPSQQQQQHKQQR